MKSICIYKFKADVKDKDVCLLNHPSRDDILVTSTSVRGD